MVVPFGGCCVFVVAHLLLLLKKELSFKIATAELKRKARTAFHQANKGKLNRELVEQAIRENQSLPDEQQWAEAMSAKSNRTSTNNNPMQNRTVSAGASAQDSNRSLQDKKGKKQATKAG